MNPRYRILPLAALLLFLLGCSTVSFTASSLESTVSALESQVADLATRRAHDAAVISYLATRVGEANQLPSLDRTTPTPYVPLESGVLIEEGRCCIGAPVGETIEIAAAFNAASMGAGALAAEMRVLAGTGPFAADDFETVPWEPFRANRTFTYQVPVNWTGYYVCVQYRAADGALSEVFCDDISVEGNPTPRPT